MNKITIPPHEIVRELLADPVLSFKEPNAGSTYLTGKCPQCHQKSLFVKRESPWMIKCNHDNSCGYNESVRNVLPQLFEEFAKRYPPTEENRKATADAYLTLNRGFDLSKIRGWYEQGAYLIPKSIDRYIPTVKFYLNPEKTCFWERFIENAIPGQKANFGGTRKEDGSLFKGEAWMPPGMTFEDGDRIFLVEGILHAIALAHVKIKAIACMSCNHFPAKIIEAHREKDITWVLAMDGDMAGQAHTQRHLKQFEKFGLKCEVALPPPAQDWDDLYRQDKLTPELIDKYLWNGKLSIAKSAQEKAYIYYQAKKKKKFVLDSVVIRFCP